MRSIAIGFLLVFSTTRLFSQQLTKDAFPGSWKVVDAQIMTEMQKGLNSNERKNMEQVRKGFIGTILNFKPNNEFSIRFTNKIPEFMKELAFLDNRKWKIESEKLVAVGTKEDNYSLMKIAVVTKQGKKYFILDESPFILEVIEQ